MAKYPTTLLEFSVNRYARALVQQASDERVRIEVGESGQIPKRPNEAYVTNNALASKALDRGA